MKQSNEMFANYINGHFLPSESGRYIENVDPSTGRVYSNFPSSNQIDVARAVAAAESAFPLWSKESVDSRAHWLHRIANELRKHKVELSKAESRDQGKPIKAAEYDIERSASFFDFFGQLILSESNPSFKSPSGNLDIVRRFPVGACALITPWNFPLSILCWKLAPCLAVGNTAVCKPSELTPYTAFQLSKILHEIGLPAGVVNIIHGSGELCGEELVKHSGIKAVSFTGSSETGKRIASLAAPRLAKVSLEMGGKNPNIIFSDCDMEAAVATAIRAAFYNQGEVCLSGSKILVEAPIYQTFVEIFKKHTEALTVGDPASRESFMGALVSKDHLEKVLSFVHLAREEGAKVLTEPNVFNLPNRLKDGFFMSPVIITNLPSNSSLNKEEIFGPVVSISPFKTNEEAIAQANATDYGLSASIWTSDLNKAFLISDSLEVGTVWVNSWMHRNSHSPFGGWKASGLGQEGGKYSLDFYTKIQNLSIKY